MTDDMDEICWVSAGLADVPSDNGWMDPLLASRLDGLRYAKRFSESRLSRWAAKLAVAKAFGLSTDLGTLANVVVHNAVDGAPYASINGSNIDAVIAMTDRADWAVCAVLRGRMRIGCDLELVEPRSAVFVADYLTSAEQQAVASSNNPDVVANVIWSAKESALKVLRTGLRRDTRSVDVILHGTATDEWQPLEVRAAEGIVFPGWWIRFGDFVMTVAAEQPTARPTSLEDPPGLATALPTHRWMQGMA